MGMQCLELQRGQVRKFKNRNSERKIEGKVGGYI